MVHLAVDEHRVQALLAAEVLVDHRLGDTSLGGDLLDRDNLKALVGKQLSANIEQLFASLLAAHADPAVARRAPGIAPLRARQVGHVVGLGFEGVVVLFTEIDGTHVDGTGTRAALARTAAA